MTEPTKIEKCGCDLRKKIVINIVNVLSEEECSIPDAALADVLDWELNGPKGQPVLRIRFCPWCGKRVEKPEMVTQFEPEDEIDEGDQAWRGTEEDE